MATEKFGATTARKLVSTAIGHLSAVAATKGTFEPAVVAVVLRAAQSIVECGCDIGFLDRCVCEATAPRLAAPCFLAVFLPSTGSDPPPSPPPSGAVGFICRRLHDTQNTLVLGKGLDGSSGCSADISISRLADAAVGDSNILTFLEIKNWDVSLTAPEWIGQVM